MLPALARAVFCERRIIVRYNSWTAQSVKDLAPLGIVLKAGVWYLVALGSKGKPATYRVSSIRSLDLTEVEFKRPTDFDLQAYWTVAVREMATRLHRGTATLRVSGRGFQLLGKLSPEVMQAAEQTRSTPDAAGWTVIEIPVEHTDNAICDILSLGIEAELLAPPALLAALTQSVSCLAERYAHASKQ